MSKHETEKSTGKPLTVDEMVAAVVNGTDWSAEWKDDDGQYLVTFRRGESVEEIGLNKTRLDPKAHESRAKWLASTRATLASEGQVAS